MNSKESRKLFDAFASATAKLFASNPAYKKKFLNLLKKLDYPHNPFDSTEEKKRWLEGKLSFYEPNWEDSSKAFADVIDKLLNQM